jgi:predicted membrane-bound mannosyltransferase
MQQIENVADSVEKSTRQGSPEAGSLVETPRGGIWSGERLVTIEGAAYVLIGVISLLLHLWALGDRALHHDETLHASYSWNIYTGRGYMHDPLLHGPFLYYLGALVFFVFGDNDFTARLGFALFGTVLTLLPFLVRRELGRPAALFASLYMLVSPTFLYVGRFARHDIYSVTFEMLVIVGLVRYASTRAAGWLYLAAAAFGLMYTNQETSYLFLLIVAVPLVGLLLWRLFKPAVALLAVVAVAVAALIFVLPGEAEVDAEHRATRDPDTGLIVRRTPLEGESLSFTERARLLVGWQPLETEDNSYALCIRNRADTAGYLASCESKLYGGKASPSWLSNIGFFFMGAGAPVLANFFFYFADLWLFFRHPAVLLAIAPGLALLFLLVWGARVPLVESNGARKSLWQRALARGDRVVATWHSLATGKRWLIALGIFFAIYAVLFTSLMTNLIGVVSGTTGSLLYWLAQHNVQRGSQPGYYYGVMLFLYEPLLLVGGAIGLIMVVVVVVRRFLAQYQSTQLAHDAHDAHDESHLFPLFLAWWSLAAVGIYSWAGEKMPWLTLHLALPLLLLSAWAAQRMIWGLREAGTPSAEIQAQHRFLLYSPLTYIFVSIFTVTVGMGFFILSTFDRIPIPAAILFVLIPGLLIMLLFIASTNWGPRWAFAALTLGVLLVGGLYTMRNAQRVTYRTGDVPRDPLIYTQTSPDVPRIVDRLEEISIRRTGGLHMPVIYDNETVWTWYLRDFTNATRSGPQLGGPPDPEVQAVVILQENLSRHPTNRDYLQPFELQRFPLRWWFPEYATYRLPSNWREASLEDTSLMARVLRAPLDDATFIRMRQFIFYRELNDPLGSTDFVLAVRPSIASQVGPGIGVDLHPSEEK